MSFTSTPWSRRQFVAAVAVAWSARPKKRRARANSVYGAAVYHEATYR